MLIVKLNAAQSLALAVVVYFIGTAIRRRVPLLMRLSIPTSIVGGLLFAARSTVLRLNALINMTMWNGLKP